MSQDNKQEIIFYEKGEIKVSSSRFILAKQTFAMSGVTSVRTDEEIPSKTAAILLIVAGILLFFTPNTASYAILPLLAGAGLWYLLKAKYHIFLQTASGESNALTSPDKELIAKVVKALNDAIVQRG